MTETSKLMTVSEAREFYAGKWLALEVVARDKTGMPKKVRLLAQASSRLELREHIRSLHDVYIAFAGPVVPTGQGILYTSHAQGSFMALQCR